LASRGVNLRPFWIANVLMVENINSELLTETVNLFPQIIAVHLDRELPIVEPLDPIEALNGTVNAEWGINMIKAPAAWSSGITGSGIVVANIDTGVLYTHVALQSSYRGTKTGSHDYNWYDKTRSSTAYPSDGNGHGTHVMGTIAGSSASGVGVAYGATWIAAKGCGTASCSSADLLGSGEFLACPTRIDGRNPDCTKAPHVINNSWGGGQGDTWYRGMANTWRAAGIIPVFAAGNSGPNCGTHNSPGDNDNVIAVAASDSADKLASFSSRGPSVGGSGIGAQKPDVTAPGAAIRSAWYTGNTAYNTISGTSMASPHVTGTIALMFQANPNLSYTQIYNVLTSQTDRTTLGVPNGGLTTCGGKAYNVFPNFHYGYGRINAQKAVQASLALLESNESK